MCISYAHIIANHSYLHISREHAFLLNQLHAWNPEDQKQWEAVGKFIAKRNLLASIPNLLCGFGVWLVWSGEFLYSYIHFYRLFISSF